MDRLTHVLDQLRINPAAASASSTTQPSNNRYGTPKPSVLIKKYLEQPIYKQLKQAHDQSLRGKTLLYVTYNYSTI